jgi:multiple sugar transport system permease protein
MKNISVPGQQSRMAKRDFRRAMVYLGIILMSVWSIFPFLWMVIISLKERIYTYDPSVWIFSPTFENYVSVFSEKGFGKFLTNSAVVAVFSTVLALVIGTVAAYGFSRFKFKKNGLLMFALLSIRMIPSVAIVIPLFVVARILRILDTHILLIVAYLIFNVPFTVWMMKGFFDDIPRELEEAARVDGCTGLQSLYRVTLPVAAPGLVATAIFCVISSWNEFVFSMFLTSIKAVTTPTIVQMFLSVQGVLWGEMCAVGTVATLPVLVFAMIVQKNMIRGLSFGAVKG